MKNKKIIFKKKNKKNRKSAKVSVFGTLVALHLVPQYQAIRSFFKLFAGHCLKLNRPTFKDYGFGRFSSALILLLFLLLPLLLFLLHLLFLCFYGYYYFCYYYHYFYYCYCCFYYYQITFVVVVIAVFRSRVFFSLFIE